MSEEFLLRDDRPLRYVEGDTVVYRASGLGACERAVVAIANGYKPAPVPADIQRAMDEGTQCEPLIDAKFRKQAGTAVTSKQKLVELEIGEIDGKLIIVRGHIDGKLAKRKTVVDYKKFRVTTWDDWLRRGIEVNPNYGWQMSVYMIAMECDGLVVGGRAEFDEWGTATITDLHEVPLLIPPFNKRAIVKRVARWERLINQGFDAKEVECKRNMYPCPAYKLHDIVDGPEAFTVPESGEGVDLMHDYVKMWVKAEAELKAAKEMLAGYEHRKRQAADALKATLDLFGTPATEAKVIHVGEVTLNRVRKTIPAHERKESTQDYFQLQKAKDSDS